MRRARRRRRGVHRGRPLACRLYPLGIERIEEAGDERICDDRAGEGVAGVHGSEGTVNDFVDAQGVGEYPSYRALFVVTRRVSRADRGDGRLRSSRAEEFWRHAAREALAESNYDANPLIDAMFHAEKTRCGRSRDGRQCGNRRGAYRANDGMIRRESNAELLAAAAVMLAVSFGFSPDEAKSATPFYSFNSRLGGAGLAARQRRQVWRSMTPGR